MRKVFVKEESDFLLCALYEGEELMRFYRLPKRPLTGSIVLGRVKFVKKSVGVFVDIGLERDGILTYRPGIKSGDGILVRIETEPQEDRGCSLSEKITMAGKYVVLTDEGVGFSKEISEEKRKELALLPRPQGCGVVFRSLSAQAKSKDVEEEMKSLAERYAEILNGAKKSVPIRCFYEENALSIAKNMADEVVEGFDDETENAIRELSRRKVEREGVELVFGATEAMTAVDVNFHRFQGQGEGALFSANATAVKEFARQLRLRNIGGIVLLDYVSLKNRKEKEALFSLLKEELKKDFVRCEAEHADKAGVFIVTRTDRYSS